MPNNLNPLEGAIRARDWSAVDSLPLALKVQLLARVAHGMDMDLHQLKSALWGLEPTVALPKAPGPLVPSPTPRSHPFTEPFSVPESA